jgi:hypothetical protein
MIFRGTPCVSTSLGTWSRYQISLRDDCHWEGIEMEIPGDARRCEHVVYVGNGSVEEVWREQERAEGIVCDMACVQVRA